MSDEKGFLDKLGDAVAFVLYIPGRLTNGIDERFSGKSSDRELHIIEPSYSHLRDPEGVNLSVHDDVEEGAPPKAFDEATFFQNRYGSTRDRPLILSNEEKAKIAAENGDPLAPTPEGEARHAVEFVEGGTAVETPLALEPEEAPALESEESVETNPSPPFPSP